MRVLGGTLIAFTKRQIIYREENWEELNQSISFRNFPMLDVFPLSRRARALCGVFTVCCIAMACRQAERLQAVGDHFRWAPSHFHLSQIPLSMFAVSLLHVSQKQCSYDTSMSAESSDHSCNKRPWQSKLGQQGHNKKREKTQVYQQKG